MKDKGDAMAWGGGKLGSGNTRDVIHRIARRNPRIVLAGTVIFSLVILSLLSHPVAFVSILLPSSWLAGYDKIEPRPTRFVGGVPGYTVFDNLWFNNGVFHYFSDSPIGIDGDIVTIGRDAIVSHPFNELEDIISSKPTKKYAGESIWINTGYGGGNVPNLVGWYYHFATELVMGPTSVLSAIRYEEGSNRGERLADHLLIPGVDWKDQYHLNEILVDGTYKRETDFVDRQMWEGMQMDGKAWFYFDRVVIADRGASTSDPIVQEWNKMALHALSLPRPREAFEPLRNSMSHYLNTPTTSRKIAGKALNKIPKIVYVDRQDTSRKLVPDDHEGLVGYMRGMEKKGKVEFVHGKFGSLGLSEQVKSLLDADIVIGVHGNGLTHQLFMSSGGVVVEFFLPETFLRDYQIVAEALSHTHYAIRNDKIYPRSEWELHPGEENPSKLHDGTEFPLDQNFIQRLLIDIVDGMTNR